jgi:hypothetical protein
MSQILTISLARLSLDRVSGRRPDSAPHPSISSVSRSSTDSLVRTRKRSAVLVAQSMAVPGAADLVGQWTQVDTLP